MEIKFRAWDKDLNEMYGWSHILTGYMQGYLTGYYNAELMQYTGLKDKNGVEIYEGDIVRYTYLPGEGFWNFDQFAVIKWKGTGFYFNCFKSMQGAKNQGWLVSLPGAMPECSHKVFEVIGNIYQHSSFLEEPPC